MGFVREAYEMLAGRRDRCTVTSSGAEGRSVRDTVLSLRIRFVIHLLGTWLLKMV